MERQAKQELWLGDDRCSSFGQDNRVSIFQVVDSIIFHKRMKERGNKEISIIFLVKGNNFLLLNSLSSKIKQHSSSHSQCLLLPPSLSSSSLLPMPHQLCHHHMQEHSPPGNVPDDVQLPIHPQRRRQHRRPVRSRCPRHRLGQRL